MLIFKPIPYDKSMSRGFIRRRKIAFCGLIGGLLLAGSGAGVLAETRPEVWGYGVQGCVQYMEAYIGQSKKDPRAVSEFRLYREWFAGTISGLSAATAMDVLKGMELEDALKRLQVLCQQQAAEDVFTMTMTLVRERNTPGAAPPPAPAAPPSAPTARPRADGFGRASPEARTDCGPGGSIATAGGCR